MVQTGTRVHQKLRKRQMIRQGYIHQSLSDIRYRNNEG